ncbi:MAG: HAD family hydrolase [Actinomycetota bacterium]|nr:HAD family hydrolase [Actinomycetota bacterium]
MRRVDGIRAVTYDCWGTLLKDRDWEGAMEIRLSALLRSMDLSEDEGRKLLDEAWARHDEAWKQVETFGPGRMAAYCLEAKGIFDDDKIAALTEEFELASTTSGIEAVDGARETLERLRSKGIRLGLVCDTGFTPGRVVRERLAECQLAEYLEVLCFSDEVGVPKPGHEIFDKALAELGVRPPDALHVGDLKRTDIAGAHDVGMHAVRFRGVHNDKTDATEAESVIDRHEQIFEVLGLD